MPLNLSRRVESLQPWLRKNLAIASGLLSLVGPLGAQVGVDANGMPSFSQAISVPPGISGMAPNLSLAFSGGGINGPVGQGWSIQGISSITRCPGLVAIDAAPKPVAFTPADKVCLDGQRLIRTNADGVPVAANRQANGALDDAMGQSDPGYIEYRTEKDSYARIRAYGSAGGTAANGPAHFRVWTKSGQIYDYGAAPGVNANSNALVQTSTGTAVVWAVSRISDTVGNYIDFIYNQRTVQWGSGPTSGSPTAGREWNLVEVQYTGNAVLGKVPRNKVIFEYEDRPAVPAGLGPNDRAEAYHQGQKNVSVQLLKGIRTYLSWLGPALGVAPSPSGTPLPYPAGSAVKVNTIKLGYDKSPATGRSRLASIVECAGADENLCRSPTTFGYSANTKAELYEQSGAFASTLATIPLTNNQGTKGVLLGDFFGRGRQDILRWSETPNENVLYASGGDGSFIAAPAFNVNGVNDTLFNSTGCYHSMLTDINADGLPDIMRYSGDVSTSGAACPLQGPTYVYLNKGDGSFNRVQINSSASSPAVSLRRIRSTVDNCGGPIQGLCANGDPYYRPGWTEGANFFVLDVDGDGRTDILTTYLPAASPSSPSLTLTCPLPLGAKAPTCTQYWRGLGDGSFELATTNLMGVPVYVEPVPGSGVGAPRNIADVDGDGLADLVALPVGYYSAVSAYRSTGNGNFVATASPDPCDVALDYNGDGRADCLLIGGTPDGNGLRTGIGAGNFDWTSTFNLRFRGEQLGSPGVVPATFGVVIADFNGDGRSDILRWANDPTKNALYLSGGDGAFAASTTFRSSFNGVPLMNTANRNVEFTVGDFTGRGTVEILRMASSPTGAIYNQLYVRQDMRPADLLLSVTSPSGLTTRLSYAAMANPSLGIGPTGATVGFSSPRYSSGRTLPLTSTYPRVDLAFPSYLVATVEADTGVGNGVLVSDYAYKGLRASLDGRGLLGFAQASQQNAAPNGEPLTVVTDYLQVHPYIGGVSTTVTTRGGLGAAGPMISRATHAYCDHSASATPPTVVVGGQAPEPCLSPAPSSPTSAVQLVRRPYLAETFEEARDLGSSPSVTGTVLPTVRSVNSYNLSGDPTSIRTTKTGFSLVGDQTFVRLVENTYGAEHVDTSCSDIRTCYWILGRLTSAKVTNTVPTTGSVALANVPTSPGSNPNASATTGTLPAPSSVSVVDNTASTIAAVQGGAPGAGTVTFKNSGTAAATLTFAGLSAPYGTASNGCIVPPNQGTCVANVTMATAGNVGQQPPQTLIATGAGNGPVAATVQGTLTAAPTSSVSIYENTASMMTAMQGAAPATGVVRFRNSGTAAATLSFSPLSTPYSADSTGCVIQPNQGTCSVNVTMATSGAAGQQLPAQTLVATGASNGPVPASILGTLTPAPSSSVTMYENTASTMTAVQGGPVATGVVKFRNNGNAAATLTFSQLSAPYSTTSTGCVIQPQQDNCVVDVTMTTGGPVGQQLPAQSLVASGASNGPVSATVLGTLTAAPSSSVAVTSNTASTITAVQGGSPGTGTVTFKNTGTAAATLTFGGLSAPYYLTPSGCTIMAVTGECTVNVTMSTGGALGAQPSQTLVATGASNSPVPATVQGTLTSAVLQLNGCVPSAPTTTPDRATYVCTLANVGTATATGISYATLMNGSPPPTGPSSCSAGNNNCGQAILSSGHQPGFYNGTLTATPALGLAATSAPVNLRVLTDVQLTYYGCDDSGWRMPPDRAWYRCRLGNTGETAATTIWHKTSIATASITGPESCSASQPNCGEVEVSSGALGSFTGDMTSYPNRGLLVSRAGITLSVVAPNLTFPRGNSWNAGEKALGSESLSPIFELRNSGTGPASPITAQLPASGAYDLVGGLDGGCTQNHYLAANTSCYFQIRFRPTQAIDYSGTIYVTSNGVEYNPGAAAQFQLSGSGSSTPPQTSISVSVSPPTEWVIVDGGGIAQFVATATNNGSVAATNLGISITPPYPFNSPTVSGGYQISGGTCLSGGSIGPNGSCTVEFTYYANCGYPGQTFGLLTFTGANFSDASALLSATTRSGTTNCN